jgi:hypothetical protein
MNPKYELDSPVSAGAFQGSASSAAWSSKLKPDHYERSAIVYVRQSTAQQVLHHRESAARQYSLVELAVRLGCPSG